LMVRVVVSPTLEEMVKPQAVRTKARENINRYFMGFIFLFLSL
jgi:hypothetical protein